MFYLVLSLCTFAVFVLCVCVGSVAVSPANTFTAVWNTLWGLEMPDGVSASIIVSVRLPRVLCVAMAGAALALCGGAMQGLLRNPLADGSTLGVSSGASLGAVAAIALGVQIPGFSGGGIMLSAIVFACLSLFFILTLAYRLDKTLATNTVILVGVVFSMFCSSLISLVISFAGEKVKTITFWTMGSLAGSSYADVLTIAITLAGCSAVILCHTRELNAFAMGEDNARSIGVHVRRVKLVVLVSVSILIGVCVSIGGTIGFVGLIIPHITRMLTGPNHKRLLPACLFIGAVFLMMADLLGRTLLSPREIPIGVVTSIIGAVAFVVIFAKSRRAA